MAEEVHYRWRWRSHGRVAAVQDLVPGPSVWWLAWSLETAASVWHGDGRVLGSPCT